MARWGLWAGSAIGAAGAGAGLALLRRRRAEPADPSGPAGPSGFDAEVAVPVPEPADAAPPDDPQAALDAARARLRERADALRDQIERDGEDPAPGG
jgi:hypothetical protein